MKRTIHNNMRTHKTKTVKLGKFSAEIDEKIAPLIEKLWNLGIRTFNSCENNVPKNYVWIEFCNFIDAKKFLDLSVKYNTDLYNRVFPAFTNKEAAEKNQWIYKIIPTNLGVEQTIVDNTMIENFTGKNDFSFYVSVRFPQSDLEDIMKNLSEKIH